MKNIYVLLLLLVALPIWSQTENMPSIATLSMAKMQLNPNHLFYNPKQGFISCQKAATTEANSKAMNMLAVLYSEGVGTEPNQELALEWFEKAANAGYLKAWYNVGIMHQKGLGTPQDFKKAYAVFDKASQIQQINCMFGKAYLLYKGLGCQQNYNQAFELLKVSSKYGNLGAMYLLGICYRNGYGTPKDLVLAKEWLTKSAHYGHIPAVNEMMEAEPEFGNYKPTLNSYSKKKTTNTEAKTHFELVQHRINSTTSLDGSYTGYLVTYDWSGQHIIAKEPLTVDLKSQNDGTFTGTWTESNKTAVNLQGKITDTEVLFDNTAYTKVEHYSAKKPTEFQFKDARLQTISYQDSSYIAGNIQLWSVRQNEPEKPMYINLVKKKQTTTATPLKTDNLVVYPNPFSETISFNISLKEQTTVDIALYALTGAVLYTEKLALPAGDHSHTIRVNVPKGIYVLKLNYGKTTQSTLVIKS